MSADGHHFRNGGRCVWCGATREKVQDRRAPPFCPERPEELRESDRKSVSPVTGY